MQKEVLISTMNLRNNQDLIKKMTIFINSITINQCESINSLPDIINSVNKLYNYDEKGLSRSRNHAIKHSNTDICIITDEYTKETIKYGKKYNVPVIVDVRDLWTDIFNHNLSKTFRSIVGPYIKLMNIKTKNIQRFSRLFRRN